MTILKTIYKKEIIFFINNEILDDSTINKILADKDGFNKKIGLDMKNIKTINSKLFVNCLIENKFKLFNLNSEILAYLSIVLKKGYLKSFVNSEDFTQNKREFFKRYLEVI